MIKNAMKAVTTAVAATRAPAPAPAAKPARPAMPAKSNAGGAVRGLARAAQMSGRTMPTTGKPATAGMAPKGKKPF